MSPQPSTPTSSSSTPTTSTPTSSNSSPPSTSQSLLLRLQTDEQEDNLPEVKSIFEYLSLPLLSTASDPDRLECLQTLLPRTELQLEYWFDADPNPANWAITFPVLGLEGTKTHDTTCRYREAIVQRHLKSTWKEFCASHIKDIFLLHTNTVTLAVRLQGPAYMYIIGTFDPKTLPKFEAEYHGLENCYISLDADYIQQQVGMKLDKWRIGFSESIGLSIGLIEALVDDLREMKDGGCWP